MLEERVKQLIPNSLEGELIYFHDEENPNNNGNIKTNRLSTPNDNMIVNNRNNFRTKFIFPRNTNLSHTSVRNGHLLGNPNNPTVDLEENFSKDNLNHIGFSEENIYVP